MNFGIIFGMEEKMRDFRYGKLMLPVGKKRLGGGRRALLLRRQDAVDSRPSGDARGRSALHAPAQVRQDHVDADAQVLLREARRAAEQ